MFEKPKIALCLVFALGAASPALASNHDRGSDYYGGPTQTWQNIEQARQDVQRRIQRDYHIDKAGSTDGYVASPKHHPSHKQTHDR
jgi:hypothetical protein